MKVTGYWSVEFPVKRFGELVVAVEQAQAAGIPWDAGVDLELLGSPREMTLILSSANQVTAELAECGNHVGERRFDVMLPLHACEDGL